MTAATTFERRHVDLATGPLDFYVSGTGAPLLYLHSAGGPRFTASLERLAEAHTVYVPVAPGFDGTDLVAAIRSVPQLAAHYAAFVESLGVDTVDLVGHSFGGWTALHLALAAKGRIGQLVLEAPAGLHANGSVAEGGTPEEIQARFFVHPERVPARDPEQTAENRAAFAAYRTASVGSDGVDQELVARLGEIDSWAIVLLGTRDGVVPAETGRLLKRALQHVYLMYVYEAAHNIEIDQPERFDRVVGEFLKRGEAFIINFGDRED